MDQGGGRHGANQAARGGAGRVVVCAQGGGLQPDPVAAAADDRMSLPGLAQGRIIGLVAAGKDLEIALWIQNQQRRQPKSDLEGAFSAAC